MLLIYKHSIVFFCLLIFFTSCKKFIAVDAPYTKISAGNIYTSDPSAASVLTGIYTKLGQDNTSSFQSGFSGISLLAGLSSDEITLFSQTNQSYSRYYANSLLSSSTQNIFYWKVIYPLIYSTNAAIEGVNSSNAISTNVKNQLIGEAKFVRAFCYFYLVNLYGEVPLATTSDYSVNSSLIRSPNVDVFNQIIQDLKDAEDLLSEQYLKGDASTPYAAGSEERLRPTKWAAAALLARAYLFTGQWANAESEATKVIGNLSLYKLEVLSSVFNKNNREAIWQLQPTGTGISSNTGDGKIFNLPAGGPGTNFPVYLSKNVVNSFEANDQRKVNWINSVTVGSIVYSYPYKYKIGAVNTTTKEYNTVIRLAELYLIRAEAKAQQNNLTGAIDDLDKVRQRAQLPLIAITNPGISKINLLTSILHERQVELFTEWGHRWLDLKRTGNVDAVMSLVTSTKGGTWETTDKFYPIPSDELQKAPQLIQNDGY